ncbi:S8 family peptidase [Limnobacter sp.]|uniref:S8 family peptidase n=1 Tax=Limnobacter sp. TaxID=2003368 RepID=UPI00351406D3
MHNYSATLLVGLGLSLAASAAQSEPLPNHYIIVLKSDDVLSQALDLPLGAPAQKLLEQTQNQLGLDPQQITYRYQHAFKGFAAKLPDHVANGLKRSGLVAYIEQDQTIRLNNTTQNNAVWGLDRLDTRPNTRDMQYTYTSTGARVHAYVVDTGIRGSHREFTGRIGNGFDATTGGSGGLLGGGFLGGGGLFGGGLFGPPSSPPPSNSNPSNPQDTSTNPSDCNGHGTHVAGTIGGTQFGVAKNVTLHGVRVFNCTGTGTTSTTIAGVDWVIQNHVKPAVMNLSLGGGASTAMDQAIRSAHNAGSVAVVAAGNDSRDACGFSPAREPLAITVASTDINDRRSSFSNIGSCVDIFAPGSNIVSADIANDNAQRSLSGTSMAAPHVAGAAAKLLSQGVAPADVVTLLKNNATPGLVTDSRNTANLLLYSR